MLRTIQLTVLFVAFGVLGTSELKAAGPLYGSDILTDELLTIDTSTGAGTVVGS